MNPSGLFARNVNTARPSDVKRNGSSPSSKPGRGLADHPMQGPPIHPKISAQVLRDDDDENVPMTDTQLLRRHRVLRLAHCKAAGAVAVPRCAMPVGFSV